jgi:hypothetical protein
MACDYDFGYGWTRIHTDNEISGGRLGRRELSMGAKYFA